MSRSTVRFALVPAVLLASAVGLVAAAGSTPATASDGLFATLKGAKEVPGPGDPDGSGAAIVKLYPGKGLVCATFSTAKLDTVILGHIHRGGPTAAGPVVIDLTQGAINGKQCARGVDEALVREIQATPGQFYVNVHTEAYPDGAVRGQLKR